MDTESNGWTVMNIKLERMWMDVVEVEFKVFCRHLLEWVREKTRKLSHGSQYRGLN